jgi:recombination protein RecA
MDKTYGKGTVMKLGDEAVEKVEAIPSGSLTLDLALGIQGYPKGRVVEIYGPESSGKTTLAIHAIAQAQKQGGICAIIDAEHAFDKYYAENLGVDTENLLISQPDNGEQGLEIADNLIRSGAIDLIVIDSVAALTPRAEIEGEMSDSSVGLQARLMSKALRKLTGSISKTGCCCIFINQLREKIGIMFGNPETTTGGNALKFYSSVRLDIRRSTQIKDGDKVMGNRTKVKIVKNKVAPPFRRAEFDILYGQGISKSGEIIDLGVEMNIINKSGSWFSYGDTKLGQGRDAVRALIEDNPELMEELESKIKEAMAPAPKAEEPVEAVEAV